MKSFSEWRNSQFASSPNASTASWSAENGVLSEQESGGAPLNRIKLNDLDLKTLRARRAGQWQILASSISGHGHGFVGQLYAEDDAAQTLALQALQDIYDLAYLTQRIAVAQAPCEFGDLHSQDSQTVAGDAGRWSDIRRPDSGRTAEAQILYQLAGLRPGPTPVGGQSISFAVQSFVNVPIAVEFDVDLSSNSGSKAHYHLAQTIANPVSPIILGPDAPLSRQPFDPGQCIARVQFANLAVKPGAPASGDNHRTDPGESRPPIGQKIPSLLPLATTPSLDEACPYPKAARERGETGTVLLLVHVGPDGSAIDTAIDQSSGSEILDQATASCIKASGRFAIRRTGSQAVSYWGRIKFKWGFGD